jgi:hypothetical protein
MEYLNAVNEELIQKRGGHFDVEPFTGASSTSDLNVSFIAVIAFAFHTKDEVSSRKLSPFRLRDKSTRSFKDP